MRSHTDNKKPMTTSSDRIIFLSKKNIDNKTLKNIECILRSDINYEHSNINDIIELYNIKKYIANENIFKKLTEYEIEKIKKFGVIIGNFISKINDDNYEKHYQDTLPIYIHSFWELINDQNAFKRISTKKFKESLKSKRKLIISC